MSTCSPLNLLGALIKGFWGFLLLSLLFSATERPVLAQNMADYIDEFAEMAGEAAAHFGGNVAAYEIWNEEDLHGPSSFYLPPEDYAPLLQAGYSAIKAKSGSKVLVGGLASGDTNYLASVISAQGGALKADGVGLHPYAKHTPDALAGILNNYRDVSQGKSLWITEFGWETTNQEDQASYLSMAAATFSSFGSSVKAPTWYCWSDKMNPGFGLITSTGAEKLIHHRFPKGYGVNIDPIHPYPHTPTADDLRNLGAGWVRIVYRPKLDIDFDSLIQDYKDAGIKTILILNQETLWTDSLPSGISAGGGCPAADRSIVISRETAHVDNALVEKDRDCSGNLLEIISCALDKFWNWALTTFHRVERSFCYHQRAGVHESIKRIQRLLLRSISGVRKVEGVVARMLPPNSRQKGLDALNQLIKSEGQASEGTVISNKWQAQALSQGSGVYGVEWSVPGSEPGDSYEIDARFLYIPTFFYKFALIRQTFVPGAYPADIPTVNCSPPHEEATIIKEHGETETACGRTVNWLLDLNEDNEPKTVECKATNPGDPDCDDDPATVGNGICPCEGEETAKISAPLDTQTKAALASNAWIAEAGGNGALDIFKPPGDWVFKLSDNTEVTESFTYQAESGAIGSTTELPVRDLGGAEDAFRCIVDQLLMPPSSAANICKDILVKPNYRTCAQPPECWRGTPLEHEGSGCPNCSKDAPHEIVPACTLGFDPETQYSVLFCYGNSCRNPDCETSPAIPSPEGCCGSGYALPGASCDNPVGTWWVPAGNFPEGKVTYNGYTYDTNAMSEETWGEEVPMSGVFVCDNNLFACGNQMCKGKGSRVAYGGPSFGSVQLAKASAVATEALGTQTQQANQPQNFWTTLGSLIGNAVKAIINL